MFMTKNYGKFLIVLYLFVLVCAASPTQVAASSYSTVTTKTDTTLTGATTIDFNSLTPGPNTALASLTVGGISFTALDQFLRVANSDSEWATTNGVYIDNQWPTLGNYGFRALRIDFPSVVDAFGFNFQYANVNTWRLTAYDGSGQSLRQIGLGTSGLTGYFRGIKVASGLSTIAYAILQETDTDPWVWGQGYDGVIIDNFYYKTASSVPIPGSMLLLAPGLIGLVGLRRKR
jgi:hypothetical protein